MRESYKDWCEWIQKILRRVLEQEPLNNAVQTVTSDMCGTVQVIIYRSVYMNRFYENTFRQSDRMLVYLKLCGWCYVTEA